MRSAPSPSSADRQEVVDVLHGRDPRLMVVVGPCSVHDPKAALDYANRLAAAGARAAGRHPRRHARLLREAADDGRLEGPDQRPAPRRLRRRQRRPADRPQAAARSGRARPAGRLRVPRPDHAAVHRRHGRLGRDRRPHLGEPDPPSAQLRPLDARSASRTAPTAMSRSRSTRSAPPPPSTPSPASTTPAPPRSSTPPATPTATSSCAAATGCPTTTCPRSRTRWSRSASPGCRSAWSSTPRTTTAARNRRKQFFAAGRNRRPDRRRQQGDHRGDARVVPGRGRTQKLCRRASRSSTGSRSPTPASAGRTPSQALDRFASAVQARRS